MQMFQMQGTEASTNTANAKEDRSLNLKRVKNKCLHTPSPAWLQGQGKFSHINIQREES